MPFFFFSLGTFRKTLFVCNDFSLLKYCPYWKVKFQAGLSLDFYWYGYAETCITKALANFGMFMLSTLKLTNKPLSPQPKKFF